MSDSETTTVTSAARARRRRPRLLPRLVAGGSAALLLTAGVLGYRASAEPAQARYRTVVAGPATVSQSLSLSGTVHHVSQVSVTFPVAGTVVSVAAKAGDTVTAGQPLATIDDGPLKNAVLDAEAAWRAAVSKLDLDQTAYDNAPAATTVSAAGAGAAGAAGAGAAGAAAAGAGAAGAGAASRPAAGQSTQAPSPSAPAQPGAGGSGRPSGSARPGGSMPPTATVQEAATAIAALQKTLTSLEANYQILTTQCLPAGLPSTLPTVIPTALPSGLPSALPSVVTMTATQTVTVTATATKVVTVTATPAGSGSASTSGQPSSAPPPSSTAPTSAAPSSAAPSSATPSGTVSQTGIPVPSQTGRALVPTASSSTSATSPSQICLAALEALATLPQTLSTQLTTVETTLVGAQAGLTAQAAALQAQAAQLQQQGAAMQAQAAQLQAQAAQLKAQAAQLQSQAAQLKAQSAALQQQAAAASAARAGAAGLSGVGGSKVTEATLITDRANVESTAVALQQAKDRLANATVTSPINGVVASIPWVAGQQTTANSAATVIGPGAIEITVPVALAQRPEVEVGQNAAVSSVVNQQSLAGKVTRIGLLPIATTGQAGAANAQNVAAASAATANATVYYPVVVTVPNGGDNLPEGSRVQVGIVTAKVDAPVAVAASAVTPVSTTAGTVQVFANGVAQRRDVQLGLSGNGLVQIVSGLAAGEAVVVADMELPLPGVTFATGRQQQPQSQASGSAQGQQQGGAVGGRPTGGPAQPGGQPTR